MTGRKRDPAKLDHDVPTLLRCSRSGYDAGLGGGSRGRLTLHILKGESGQEESFDLGYVSAAYSPGVWNDVTNAREDVGAVIRLTKWLGSREFAMEAVGLASNYGECVLDFHAGRAFPLPSESPRVEGDRAVAHEVHKLAKKPRTSGEGIFVFPRSTARVAK